MLAITAGTGDGAATGHGAGRPARGGVCQAARVERAAAQIRPATAVDLVAVLRLDPIAVAGDKARADLLSRCRGLSASATCTPPRRSRYWLGGFRQARARYFGRDFVELLVVDPAVRRAGVGTALLRYALGHGALGPRLHVHERVQRPDAGAAARRAVGAVQRPAGRPGRGRSPSCSSTRRAARSSTSTLPFLGKSRAAVASFLPGRFRGDRDEKAVAGYLAIAAPVGAVALLAGSVPAAEANPATRPGTRPARARRSTPAAPSTRAPLPR